MSRHHQERDRSRDRHGYRGRSQSPPDSNEKKKKTTHHRSSHQQPSKFQGKRCPRHFLSHQDFNQFRFNDIPDIKVFRKEDEPNSKGLTDVDLEQYFKKLQAERGASAFSGSNSERMRHFDAQLENNSIKEQKQKEKILHEKLLGVREEIPFYSPLLLRIKNAISAGQASTQRASLSNRLNDVLGCFYVQQSQIPSEPSFQIQNKNTSLQPKLINFDKQRIDNRDLTNNTKKKQKKDQKPLKGILKMTPEERARDRSESAPRRIDPGLITLLKEMQINKSAYPKERAEILLKPYKDSGELDYLKKNPSILTELMRGPSASNSVERSFPAPSNKLVDPYKPRYSISPQPEKPTFQPAPAMNTQLNKPVVPNQYEYAPQGYGTNYQPASHPPNQYGGYYSPSYSSHMPASNPSMMGMYPPASNPTPSFGSGYGYQQQSQQSQFGMTRNYKTVPCKYYHSPQGCVKAVGCTFIHDEEYAGRPTPSMLKSNRGMVMTSYNQGSDNMGTNYYQSYPGDNYPGQGSL